MVLAGTVRGLILRSLLESGQDLQYWTVASCLTVGITVGTGVLVKIVLRATACGWKA